MDSGFTPKAKFLGSNLSQRNMSDCTKDIINSLPDNLLCQILSNLSIKEAALTSILSKRWRYLFALVPNLDFDDLSSQQPQNLIQDKTSFIDFVDRVLELRGKDHINKFSLKCGDGFEDEDIFPWILNVLRHGVLDLSLHVSPTLLYWLPLKVFSSTTLVRLQIERYGPKISLRNVCLPKVKTLELGSVLFEEGQDSFAKLLSGCPVLEELSLLYFFWDHWDSCFVSSKTLKRLTLKPCCLYYDRTPKNVSFDCPNVVYFEYSDNVADKYSIVKFDSLVEARICIGMTNDQKEDSRYDKVKGILMGICNMKILYVSNKTLETLNFCCEEIPVFNNLTHLTIDSPDPDIGWDSLPNLLRNSPNLETLVFQGLWHNATYTCGDVCLCGGLEKNPSSLSQCPVKFLKVMNFGEEKDEDTEMEIKDIKNFLKKMPNLEQVIIYYNTSIEDDIVKVSNQLQMLHEVASHKCKVQIISDDNFSLSFTLPTKF